MTPSTDSTEPRPIPVICDACRATGMAGDEAFSAIPDILNFEPVPRRARADGWTAEHQRAFVAALAVTGSPTMAARAIGKHAFGAEQLRKARGGRSFDAACDAAIDLARDREFQRIHSNLKELQDEQAQRDERGFLPARLSDHGGSGTEEADERDYDEARIRIRNKLLNARRLFLAQISFDEEARNAWEYLCGDVDWDKAQRLEPQDNEPYPNPAEGLIGMPNMRQPDMLLTAEHGWLAEVTGGYDPKAELRKTFEEDREGAERESAEAKTNDGAADAST